MSSLYLQSSSRSGAEMKPTPAPKPVETPEGKLLFELPLSLISGPYLPLGMGGVSPRPHPTEEVG